MYDEDLFYEARAERQSGGFLSLTNQVWKQRHESRALDRVCELALMPATYT